VYVPFQGLLGRRHVVVDGAPRPGTAFTLSHWPATPTPPGLVRDLSAETALEALRQPELLPEPLDVVTLDHYDADGVGALSMLVTPGVGEAFGDLLVEVGRVGDFGVVRDQSARLVAFALEGLGRRYERRLDAVEEALMLLPELLEDPGRFWKLFAEEETAYQASVAILDGSAQGSVASIEELPEVDLAVVRLDNPCEEAYWGGSAVHSAALNSATTCSRVLVIARTGARWPRGGDSGRLAYRFCYRYESWVRLASVELPPRVDLECLAQRLSAMESGRGHWTFDGVSAPRAALCSDATAGSTIGEERLLEELVAELVAA